MTREPQGTAGRRAPLAWFVGTWALLAGFRAHAPLHLDTARDLLIARDCVLGTHCPGAGPRSSFAGLMQGTTWSRLLELREHWGWSVAAIEHAADLLLACAAALVPLVARRLDAPANGLTWALWFPATLLTIGYPRLWNPTPWPLALVATFLALLHAARTGSAAAFLAAAAALALAVDVHVAAGVLVPFGLFVAAAASRRPALVLPAAGAIFVGVLALLSPGAFAENHVILAPYAAAGLGGLSLALAAGLLARRWLAGAELRRARIVAVLACFHGLVVLTLLSLASGHGLDPRYFAPAVTPAAIVASMALSSRVSRRVQRVFAGLVVAGHVGLWAVQRATDPQFRLVEAEEVARELYGRGLAFGDLYRHLRGPRAFDLVSTLAALEPADGRAAGHEARDLLIVRTTRDSLPTPLPPDWHVVELAGAHVAVIVAAPSTFDWTYLEVCRSDGDCWQVAVDVARFAQGPDMQWAARAHAGLADLSRRLAREATIRYRLQRRASRPAPRVVLFRDDCRGWQLEAGDSEEVVAFTVTPGPRCRWWLPPLVEVDVRDLALSSLVTAAGGNSGP
ncbi:hypothetical protein [Nannocystis punicea]|uniref:Uncharacterized protein n=1 Tax=Nannocystis punicea TaxID=2995304 RepID=A0ABY7GUE0_9BACT|nr:hypothetical protein [Nannocystis poenicansa]WAS90572.1 hypothetical protein O0S08_30665 [Nannocystis poenicansa]